jgi:transposase
MRPCGNAEELERRRRRAVELVDGGESPVVVARILGVNRNSLYRWRQEAKRGGNALAAKPQTGRTPGLSDEQLLQLEYLLLQGATAHGWHNELWTSARAACLIEREFGLRFHPAHVLRILKQRLGWTSQKPEQHHRDRDDNAIQRWVRESFPTILEAAATRGAYISFVDEAGFMLGPTVRRTFAPRGKTPVHRVSNPHGRISAIGAIMMSPARDRLDLLYGLLADNLNYQGRTVAQFVRTLRTRIAGPLTILWDRIPIHECEAVEEYLAEHKDVVMEPFPPHAPELNPADGIWRYIKYDRLANFGPMDLGVLRETITTELKRLARRATLLQSFVRFTKLPIEL